MFKVDFKKIAKLIKLHPKNEIEYYTLNDNYEAYFNYSYTKLDIFSKKYFKKLEKGKDEIYINDLVFIYENILYKVNQLLTYVQNNNLKEEFVKNKFLTGLEEQKNKTLVDLELLKNHSFFFLNDKFIPINYQPKF